MQDWEGVTFFRTTQREAEDIPGLRQVDSLEGIPLYVHETLLEYFARRPLVLTARGPRLAIEKDEALVEFEAVLRRDLESGHHGD
jgi:hypothetical protein